MFSRTLFTAMLLLLPVAAKADVSVISGVVLDAGGKPVATANVKASNWISTTQVIQPMEVQTADDGSFRLELPIDVNSLSMIQLNASNQDGSELGYYHVRHNLFDDFDADRATGIRLRLSPVQTIVLRVVDEAQNPIEAAAAVLGLQTTGRLNSVQYSRRFTTIASPIQKTDAKGIASFQIPRDVLVTNAAAWQEGFALTGISYELIDPRGADSHGLANIPPRFPSSGVDTLVLKEGTSITARVVDENQVPIEGANISVTPLFEKLSEIRANPEVLTASPFRQVTDSDGQAILSCFPKNTSAMFLCTAEGYTSEMTRVDAPAEFFDEQVIVLSNLIPIGGSIKSSDGTAVADVRISAMGIDYGPNRATYQSAISQADGSFQMLISPKHVYQLVVNDAR